MLGKSNPPGSGFDGGVEYFYIITIHCHALPSSFALDATRHLQQSPHQDRGVMGILAKPDRVPRQTGKKRLTASSSPPYSSGAGINAGDQCFR